MIASLLVAVFIAIAFIDQSSALAESRLTHSTRTPVPYSVNTVSWDGVAQVSNGSAYTWEEYFKKDAECSEMQEKIPRKHHENYRVKCWLDMNGIVNAEGELNSFKMERMMKDLFKETESRGAAIEGLHECAKKVLGQTKEQKLKNFAECWVTNPGRLDMIEEHKRNLTMKYRLTTEPSDLDE